MEARIINVEIGVWSSLPRMIQEICDSRGMGSQEVKQHEASA